MREKEADGEVHKGATSVGTRVGKERENVWNGCRQKPRGRVPFASRFPEKDHKVCEIPVLYELVSPAITLAPKKCVRYTRAL